MIFTLINSQFTLIQINYSALNGGFFATKKDKMIFFVKLILLKIKFNKKIQIHEM
jgi:hypothetical protein